MTTRFLVCRFAALLLSLSVTATAFGQVAPDRVVQGVFGGTATDPKLTRSLDATVSVGGAYEDNGEPEATPFTSPFERTGYYTSLGGTLGYTWQGRNAQFGANVGTHGRYYRDDRDFLNVSRYAGIGYLASVGRRTQLAINQTVSYSPSYLTGIFPVLGDSTPGAVTALGAEYAVSPLNAFSYETTGSVGFGITRKSSLSFQAAISQTDFEENSGYDDLRAYLVGGKYLYDLSRYAKLRLGYAHRQGQYAFSTAQNDTTIHDIDVGIDYDRPLSFSRRTRLSVGMGSSVVNQPVALLDGGSVDERLEYRLSGRLGLNHDIGRTWRARLMYDRGLGFVAGFPEAVFSDAVTASLAGFVNRRVELAFYSAYTLGDVGSARTGSKLEAYSSSAGLQYGITRHLAASAGYFYYNYEVGPLVPLPSGVPSFQARSAVRGGLTLWLPMVRR